MVIVQRCVYGRAGEQTAEVRGAVPWNSVQGAGACSGLGGAGNAGPAAIWEDRRPIASKTTKHLIDES